MLSSNFVETTVMCWPSMHCLDGRVFALSQLRQYRQHFLCIWGDFRRYEASMLEAWITYNGMLLMHIFRIVTAFNNFRRSSFPRLRLITVLGCSKYHHYALVLSPSAPPQS